MQKEMWAIHVKIGYGLKERLECVCLRNASYLVFYTSVYHGAWHIICTQYMWDRRKECFPKKNLVCIECFACCLSPPRHTGFSYCQWNVILWLIKIAYDFRVLIKVYEEFAVAATCNMNIFLLVVPVSTETVKESDGKGAA